MSVTSHIEWTDATWNPVTGCSKVSPGCKHCYAERFAERLRLMGKPRYANGFRLTLQEDQIDLPQKWTTPKRIFVNSMSDLFHEDIPLEYIKRVFSTMRSASQHTYQILTKRAERLADVAANLPWAAHIWIGVSIETEAYLSRVDALKRVRAPIRFLSCEPLLGALPHLEVDGLQWVIAGGESGTVCRPMKVGWVRDIRDKCSRARVPFFFKQWGGRNKAAAGRILDGRTWDEYPEPSPRPKLAAAERGLFEEQEESTDRLTVRVLWRAVHGAEDPAWDWNCGLYAYFSPDKQETLYIGKADGCSMRERWRSKDDFWNHVERNFGYYSHVSLIGEVILQKGRRLSRQLLYDIESLLIQAIDPLGNIQATGSRTSRPGLEVHCEGAWWLPQHRFRDEGDSVLVFVRGQDTKIRKPRSSAVRFTAS